MPAALPYTIYEFAKKQSQAGDWQRGVLAIDPGNLDKTWAFLGRLDLGKGVELFPWGLEQGGGQVGLWQAYQEARDRVELYPEGPQVPGCQADWLSWDPSTRKVSLGLYEPALPSRCKRFTERECPLMTGAGAEPSHAECNYWLYPRFQELCPRLELNPEWQRFDCHRYYALFQCHLVLAELASRLNAQWRLQVAGAGQQQKAVFLEYAKLTSLPECFEVLQGMPNRGENAV